MTKSRPATVAQLAGVDPDIFRRHGAINMPIWQDAPFYIDPRLLERTEEPELLGAADEVYEWFVPIAEALASDDLPEKMKAAVIQRLRFKEPRAFALGTSTTCSGGRGIGKKTADEMADTIAVFGRQGILNPALLGFLAVTERGIGGDRISDLILNVAEARFVRYSDRKYRELGIEGRAHPKWPDCNLPVSPCNGKPIGLVPWSVVRALNTDEIGWDDLFGDNDELREFFNGRIRQQMGKRTRRTKMDYFRVLIDAKDKLERVAASYQNAPVQPYNLDKDPGGFVVDDRIEGFLSKRPPLPDPVSPENFDDFVVGTCHDFKHYVENEQALYREKEGRIPEKEVQKAFQMLARVRGRHADIDVSPETNAGSGPADFKFSKGTKLVSIVELKLADNSKLVQGFEQQIKRYMETEQTLRGVYLVVDQDGREKKLAELEEMRKEAIGAAADDESGIPPIVWIDARRRPSASKDPGPT